jgi:hypothetical protein
MLVPLSNEVSNNQSATSSFMDNLRLIFLLRYFKLYDVDSKNIKLIIVSLCDTFLCVDCINTNFDYRPIN